MSKHLIRITYPEDPLGDSHALKPGQGWAFDGERCEILPSGKINRIPDPTVPRCEYLEALRKEWAQNRLADQLREVEFSAEETLLFLEAMNNG